jgi:hypothetical protein
VTTEHAAEWFGVADHSQLSLLVRKPFFESVISKHGGRLLDSASDVTGTTFRVELPAAGTDGGFEIEPDDESPVSDQ